MRIFAIADPHLSRAKPKPMDIFGPNWAEHPAVFFKRWQETIAEDDLVLIPGDISWAMRMDDALLDLNDIAALPGSKVLLRGNHDYWWSSISKVRKALPADMYALQNDAICLNGVMIAGTRGWSCPGGFDYQEEDEKIYLRELERLKLSLAHAKKLAGEKLVVMLHYPPTNYKLEPSGFTDILVDAEPDVVVFGHIHGDNSQVPVPDIADAKVYFVAADALGFRPQLILEL